MHEALIAAVDGATAANAAWRDIGRDYGESTGLRSVPGISTTAILRDTQIIVNFS